MTVLVQNPDDGPASWRSASTRKRIALIPGSGVDIDALQPLPEPAGPITVGFVGRLLDDKGIRTLVAAHRLLRQRGSHDRPVDRRHARSGQSGVGRRRSRGAGTASPASHGSATSTTSPRLWARAHIAVLPSRREGLPMSLLEAAACGRADDRDRCARAAARSPDGETGILVPVDDAAALADAIEPLADSPDLRARYGAAARQLGRAVFRAIIGRQVVDLYRRLLRAVRARAPAADSAEA